MSTVISDRLSAQLAAAGFLPLITFDSADGDGWIGQAHPVLLTLLDGDARFHSGPFSQLHDDIGHPRTEYRSIRGSLGPGSMQIVINTETYRCYVDIDKYSPYDDVAGAVGHLFGEVIFGPLFGWLKRKVGKA